MVIMMMMVMAAIMLTMATTARSAIIDDDFLHLGPRSTTMMLAVGIAKDDVPGVEDTGDPAQEGEEAVEHEVTAASGSHEDGNRWEEYCQEGETAAALLLG